LRLVQLQVEGLKSLVQVLIEDLCNYNVFIGRNNAGKSTILQAVDLLRGLVGSVKNVDDLLCRRPSCDAIAMELVAEFGDQELPQMASEFGFGEDNLSRVARWKYRVELRPSAPNWVGNVLYLTKWWLVHESGEEPFGWIKDRDDPRDFVHHRFEILKDVIDRAQEPVPAIIADRKGRLASESGAPMRGNTVPGEEMFWFRQLRAWVGRIKTLESVRSASDSMAQDQRRETTVLDATGSLLVSLLDTWRSNAPEKLEAFEQQVRLIFPDVANVHLPIQEDTLSLRVAPDSEMRATEAFLLSHVGMGVHQAMLVIALALSAEEGDVLLLEEPELNLHPAAQRRLARFLQERAREVDAQILLTTQSTIFARWDEYSRVYLVRLDDAAGTVVEMVERQETPAIRAALGSRNIDVFGYDGAILWEGDSESVAIPLIMDTMLSQAGRDAADLGLYPVPLYGSSSKVKQSIHEFLGFIKSSDVRPYVILDQDEGVSDFLSELTSSDLLPEGHWHVWDCRARYDRSPEVGSEFEDNFSDEQLIEAANLWAEEHGEERRLEVEEFRAKLRASSSKTSKVLEAYYWGKYEYGLSKPQLNKMLARMLVEELIDLDRDSPAYELEEVVEDVVRKLAGIELSSLRLAAPPTPVPVERVREVPEPEKGFLDWLAGSEEAMIDVGRAMQEMTGATMEIGQRMQSRTEEVKDAQERKGPGVLARVRNVASAMAREIIEYADRLEKQTARLEVAWDKFEENTTPLVEALPIETPKDATTLTGYRASISGLATAIERSLASLLDYKSVVSRLKQISKDVSLASVRTTQVLDRLIGQHERAHKYCLWLLTLLDDRLQDQNGEAD